jgi:heme/flavin dehydrogenase (mycofactocin system)
MPERRGREEELANAWFETVAVAQQRARRRLPSSVYQAIWAGAERGSTLEDNVAAFEQIGFAPRVVGLPAQRQLEVDIMGQWMPMPVILSPTGVQAVHPLGEVAVARAAAARGLTMGLSCFANQPMEKVLAANPQVMFQTYWTGSRDEIAARIERARAAGAVGLIATLDWSFSHGRDWGSPFIPEKLDATAVRRYLPQVLRHPRWVLEYAKARQLPNLSVPNLDEPGGPTPTFFTAYRDWMATPPATWDDIRWMRDLWEGSFLLKGIMRVDDAKRAVDVGVTAISVSNHGGNNLDGTPATIRALPAIAQAVNSQIEVLLDGGIRRGSDVVKAIALGAQAVLIGRPYLWALAANGQAGVENLIDVIRSGIESTLLALGRSTPQEVTPDDLVIAADFHQPLGVTTADLRAAAPV